MTTPKAFASTSGPDGFEGLDDVHIPMVDDSFRSLDAQSPQFLGPYHLLHEIGFGGVARVLRARHIHPGYENSAFAVKILHDALARDPQVVPLFRNEAYLLSLLQHPNIVRTFEAGIADHQLFIAMEFVDGRDLDKLARRAAQAGLTLPFGWSVYVVAEVLKALRYAHGLTDSENRSLGLIHRDVNPANVFVSFDGRIKLGDFGVAGIAAELMQKQRTLVGKLGYFAPEQLHGEAVDHRADLFSTGAVLFELLCGVPLFEAKDQDELFKVNKKAKIPRPSKVNPNVPAELDEVILTALERRPIDRFQSAAEFLAALEPFIPNVAAMPLGIAAMVRQLFWREHVAELELREGVIGAQPNARNHAVAVCSPDDRTRGAFVQLFTAHGFPTTGYHDAGSLGAALRSGHEAAVVVTDLDHPSLNPETLADALLSEDRAVPMVGMAKRFDVEVIDRAERSGVSDLLFHPLAAERAVAAVRWAIADPEAVMRGRDATVASASSSGAAGLRTRIILISTDPELAAALTRDADKARLDIDVSPTATEAIERFTHRSYHVAIYDAHTQRSIDRDFVRRVRELPGVKAFPVLWLTDSPLVGTSLEAVALLPRKASIESIGYKAKQLRDDSIQARAFVRYAIECAVDFRYGGRILHGKTVDVSRGGLLLASLQMVPLHTVVGLTLTLPHQIQIVAHARVARVDPPNHQHATSRVGLEFERFSGTTERHLISFFADRDAAGPRSVRPTPSAEHART